MKHIITILFLLAHLVINAQSEAITSAGDNNSTQTKKVNWTIGGTVVGSSQSNSYNINAGNIQTQYRILYDEIGSDIDIEYYPNPSSDVITITLKTNDFEGYNWKLYNIKGESVQKGELKSNKFQVKVNSLIASIYILNIYNTDGERVSDAKLIKK